MCVRRKEMSPQASTFMNLFPELPLSRHNFSEFRQNEEPGTALPQFTAWRRQTSSWPRCKSKTLISSASTSTGSTIRVRPSKLTPFSSSLFHRLPSPPHHHHHRRLPFKHRERTAWNSSARPHYRRRCAATTLTPFLTPPGTTSAPRGLGCKIRQAASSWFRCSMQLHAVITRWYNKFSGCRMSKRGTKRAPIAAQQRSLVLKSATLSDTCFWQMKCTRTFGMLACGQPPLAAAFESLNTLCYSDRCSMKGLACAPPDTQKQPRTRKRTEPQMNTSHTSPGNATPTSDAPDTRCAMCGRSHEGVPGCQTCSGENSSSARVARVTLDEFSESLFVNPSSDLPAKRPRLDPSMNLVNISGVQIAPLQSPEHELDS